MILLAVYWEDAAFELDKEPQVHDVITVGWLVWRNQHAICIAGERLLERETPEDQAWYRGHTTIPLRSIIKVEEIYAGPT